MKTNRIQQPTVAPAFPFPGRGTGGAAVFAFLFLLLLSACSGRGKDSTGERIITVTMAAAPKHTAPPRSNWCRWARARRTCASDTSASNVRGWTG